MFVRYVYDTIYPISSDGFESYRVYDKLEGKYIGEQYFDLDTVDEDVYILNEEWEMQ